MHFNHHVIIIITIIIIIIIEFQHDVLAVVITVFSSVRRVITNDQRLTELSLLHISNIFLNVLAVPNKAVFCITPTLSGIPKSTQTNYCLKTIIIIINNILIINITIINNIIIIVVITLFKSQASPFNLYPVKHQCCNCSLTGN